MRSLLSIALATITASSTLGAGCAAELEPPPLPDATSLSLTDIGAEAPVAGTVDGEAFTALDARFRVVRYSGRERVDLLLSDRAIERCGLPFDRPETLVWLRFAGEGALAPGRYTTTPRDDGEAEGSSPEATGAVRPLSVHWERPVGEGLDHTIRASGRGVALVEIETASGTAVRGTLHVCFSPEGGSGGGSSDGPSPSCVRGRFDARPCWSRICGIIRSIGNSPTRNRRGFHPRARLDG